MQCIAQTHLVHGNDGLDINLPLLASVLLFYTRIRTVGPGLQSQALQHHLFNLLIRNGLVDALPIALLDHLDKLVRLTLEFTLGDELSKVNSPAQSLQAQDITGSSTSKVFLGLAPFFPPEFCTSSRKNVFNVVHLQLIVDADIVGVQHPRIVQRLQYRFLQDAREERVLVRRLVATDKRLKAFLLAQHPVQEGDWQRFVGNGYAMWVVNCVIQRELNAFD